ncbi:hypothetical protein N9C27_02785 [Luminiphilus sp.]|nr:hypothetical protein [Luminiphilus sp.]MDA8659092.1 hypothetical protein [Luminiphilus sp.]MDA8827432.1 hypothetical protein [Luminiphilus sp.]MDA9579872.1 hypothetical protein [Luminiphilus sp.]MDA9847783.1 hypothetical protein [Luminiphilus sp.]
MLTSQSYVVAMVCYNGAGLISLLLIQRFWLASLPGIYRRLLLGLLVALLLTPVMPGPESESLAPALIVALFNAAFVDGWSSARYAVWVLLSSSALCMALAALSLWFFPLKPRTSPQGYASNNPPSGVQPDNFQSTQHRDIS